MPPDQKVCHVSFKHDTKRRLSACIVSEGERILAVGFAQCSLSDQFNRRAGRKTALKDALSTHREDFRRTVWETYFQEFPKDKTNAAKPHQAHR